MLQPHPALLERDLWLLIMAVTFCILLIMKLTSWLIVGQCCRQADIPCKRLRQTAASWDWRSHLREWWNSSSTENAVHVCMWARVVVCLRVGHKEKEWMIFLLILYQYPLLYKNTCYALYLRFDWLLWYFTDLTAVVLFNLSTLAFNNSVDFSGA